MEVANKIGEIMDDNAPKFAKNLRSVLVLSTLLTSPSLLFAKNYIVKLKQNTKKTHELGAFAAKPIGYSRSSFALNLFKVEDKNGRKIEELKEHFGADIDFIEEDYPLYAFETPDDANFEDQNGLKRMKVPSAWALTTGSAETLIAVSDTGMEMSHPDLVDNLYTNLNEIPDNGIDDDGNGHIDDVHGWNFLEKSNNPADDGGHGTHVSGIIGASGNNGIGVAGVNWNVKIMPVRFLGAKGGSTSDGIATIMYAADNGARVINCSWGGGGSSKALEKAINYAFKKGVLVIAAAGNDSKNIDKTPSFPAAYKSQGLLTIASSKSIGKLSSFSNYGQVGVDLAAPGSNILATFLKGKYRRLSGTSMATPMVTGVAALMLSYAPKLTALQLRNGLMNATVKQNAYMSKLSTGGELDANMALTQLDEGYQIWPSYVVVESGQDFTFATYKADGDVTWSISEASNATISADGTLKTVSGKEGTVVVTATDSAGNIASTGSIKFMKPKKSGGGGCMRSAMASGIGFTANSSSAVFYITLLLSFLATSRIRRKFFN